MKLLLSDVLNLDIFKDSKIVAGKNALNNEVSFATIMDVPDIVQWLHGGEILLAAKLFDSCVNASFFLDLKAKSVAAIITKPQYTVNLDQALIDLCETLCLPIIAVPRETAWSDILNPITQLVAEKQYQAIYQSQLFHSALMSFMVRGGSLESLCNDIYENFEMSLALTDSNFTLLSSSQSADWNYIMERFSLSDAVYSSSLGISIKNSGIPGYVYSNEYLENADQKISSQQLSSGRQSPA